MTMSAPPPLAPATFPCENCGHWFTLGTLVCQNCGALVYRRRLEELAAEAMRVEPADPLRAAMVWRQCLDLLPPQSQQYQSIAHRIGTLSAGLAGQGIPGPGGGAAAPA